MARGLFFIFIFLITGTTYAQSVKNKKDLKVGVVLSGGGAKGLAHIGALKVIEAAGVKIDYIGGTSMGAIVGGLYASGYNAKQLDSLFRDLNFVDLIEDNIPRGSKSFYEKSVSEKYALTLPFNNFKVTFPSAYSGGQNIYSELVRVLYHVKDVGDFSKLPIPFLCIATNVETGDEVLLDRGYLPEAIMASGTFPSLFEPAPIGDQILIDGGVVNNYPIEEVRKMGADIIIGVDVQQGLLGRDGLLSATEILLQINNYRSAVDMIKKVEGTDVYIKPDISDYSVVDFDASLKIIDSGVDAAQFKLEELEKIASAQNVIRNSVKPLSIEDSLIVKQVILKGNESYTSGFVKGKLRFSNNEKITFDKLKQGINNLSATDNFKTIRYELLTNGDGVDLIIDLRENPTKTYLRLSAHYDDLNKTAALINLSHKNLFMKDDVASFDFIFGDNLRYNLKYFVDKGPYWSFGYNSRYNNFTNPVDYSLIQTNFNVGAGLGLNSISFDVIDFTNQFYVQTVVREEFSFRLGAEQKYLKYSTKTLGEGSGGLLPAELVVEDGKTIFEKSNYLSLYGQLNLDTYDDKYFPSRGFYFDGDFHVYLLSSDFNNNFREFSVAKSRIGAAFSILDNLSINIETEGGFKLGTSSVTTMDFVLGGYGNDLINNFRPFFGYDFIALPGNSFVKAYSRLDLEIAPKNHVMFAANFANVDDDLFRTGEWFTEPSYSGYALGYGLESLIGPLQVFYSWSPEKKDGSFYFSIGYWF
ncbi:patatin-like phospholipase family protein [Aurantibacter crassamenti]|uniref:patatin-like phospholipase family protein n=1 Tax=Aurantibacter crassamenti TaxID=1837375 RepID=UPI001939B8C0|nr:patatin-like phospholipase family protein [Aurantibacter crassamenti]MBM1104905.1 patatin-like phospholipase family protein [Aurantibacter crassamenti]